MLTWEFWGPFPFHLFPFLALTNTLIFHYYMKTRYWWFSSLRCLIPCFLSHPDKLRPWKILERLACFTSLLSLPPWLGLWRQFHTCGSLLVFLCSWSLLFQETFMSAYVTHSKTVWIFTYMYMLYMWIYSEVSSSPLSPFLIIFSWLWTLQPWHYWHFEQDDSFLRTGIAILCIAGFFATSPATTPRYQKNFLLPQCDNQKYLQISLNLRGRGGDKIFPAWGPLFTSKSLGFFPFDVCFLHVDYITEWLVVPVCLTRDRAFSAKRDKALNRLWTNPSSSWVI